MIEFDDLKLLPKLGTYMGAIVAMKYFVMFLNRHFKCYVYRLLLLRSYVTN